MTGGIDGGHIFEAEVPLEVGVQEGNHEAARGSVHMDLDVPAVLLVQISWNNTASLQDALRQCKLVTSATNFCILSSR